MLASSQWGSAEMMQNDVHRRAARRPHAARIITGAMRWSLVLVPVAEQNTKGSPA